MILFVFRKVSDQATKRWDRGEGRDEEGRETDLSGFFLSPTPTAFSLDICLALARLGFLLSRTINEKPRGVLLEMLSGGVPPGSQNHDLISAKKCHFPHPFSDLGPVSRKSR